MLGLKLAAGPAIPLFKLDAQKVVNLVEFAVFYPGLTSITFKLQRDDGFRWNKFLDFETGAGGRYVLKNCPFAMGMPRFQFPLNLDKISAKLSIFESHDYFIGKSRQWFSPHFSTKWMQIIPADQRHVAAF